METDRNLLCIVPTLTDAQDLTRNGVFGGVGALCVFPQWGI